ncbi:MAG TPA: hypothetical protein VFO55_03975 [Gemmatimonadaceae bacterium]|nr:hypothetical protein [Gemmatimonadaceae bacterium]
MESTDKPPASRKLPVAWLLEGLLIVVSVLLAFAVDEYRETRANRDQARRALTGIAAEIEHNLGTLEPFLPSHAAWRDALSGGAPGKAGATGLDVWFATRPPIEGRTPFPLLRRSAWDAAIASGALRFVDFGVASALADVYGMQDQTMANVQRLASGPLSSITTYDPASKNASVRLLWLTLADIQSAEQLLVGLYRQHLPRVREAAGAGS